MLKDQSHTITGDNLRHLVEATAGYSGSDLAELCREAARMGLRRLAPDEFLSVEVSSVEPISIADFQQAFRIIRPSVPSESLRQFVAWNTEYGSKA